VEETCVIDGILFRFIDTAGIRSASDEIEKLGIERTYRKASEAEIILGLVDLSECHSEVGFSEVAEAFVRLADTSRQRLIIVASKADLAQCNKNVINSNFFVSSADSKGDSIGHLTLSARTGQGMDELRRMLVAKSGLSAATGTLVTNARHAQALRLTADSLMRVRDGMASGLPSDLLAEDLRSALESLGSITGAITNDELLGEVFKRFCIGK
jgi:tRNA modification GTPase